MSVDTRRSAFDLAADMLEPESNKPLLQEYWYDPNAFVRDFFTSFKQTRYQKECTGKLLERRKICVRGPHSLGKTGMVSTIVLWFALTREDMCRVNGGDWKIVTTASVERQLTKFLWPEIRKWARKSNFAWEQLGREPFDRRTELLYTQLKMEYGEAFAVSCNDPADIEGAHADHLLYIIDEAKTVPKETFDAIEGALMGAGEVFAFAISTPGEPNGRFYEIQTRKPGYEDWWVRAVTLEEAIAAGRIRPDTVEQRKRQWGETSAIFLNRVRGEFAVDALDGLIPLAWAEAAMQRGASIAESRQNEQIVAEKTEGGEQWKPLNRPAEYAGLANAVSCDVARSGNDSTVIATRIGYKCLPLVAFKSDDTMTITGEIIQQLTKWGQRECTYAVVDVIGIGAGVVDRLREQKYDVEAFHASSASLFTDVSGELTFLNRRASAWWGMRELLDPTNTISQEVILPFDEELLGDLCTPRYRRTSTGKIAVEEKDQIRKRIGRSTDRGDAVVMVYADRVFESDEDEVFIYDSPVSISPY